MTDKEYELIWDQIFDTIRTGMIDKREMWMELELGENELLDILDWPADKQERVAKTAERMHTLSMDYQNRILQDRFYQENF